MKGTETESFLIILSRKRDKNDRREKELDAHINKLLEIRD